MDASTGSTPENFKCLICDQLVYKPILCDQCCGMSHRDCLKGWHKKKDNCPKCKIERGRNREMTTIERLFLSQIRVKGCPVQGCVNKDKEMTYESLVNHITKECA